jgi:hypothetical protein
LLHHMWDKECQMGKTILQLSLVSPLGACTSKVLSNILLPTASLPCKLAGKLLCSYRRTTQQHHSHVFHLTLMLLSH